MTMKRLGSDVRVSASRALWSAITSHHESGPAPAPDVEGPWYSLEYHFVMEPGTAKRPVAPIK